MSERPPEVKTELQDLPTRCGYVAIIGAPNAGKSTLVNGLVGSKVSIVSPKVQTTRNRVLGIVLHEQSQVILVDTPGLFSPQTRLDRAMVRAAWQGAEEADATLYMLDVRRPFPNKEDDAILERLREISGKKPVFLALNKIDTVPPVKLMERAAQLNAAFHFEKTYMISALKGDGIQDILSEMAHLMPISPWMFPEDQISDLPMRLLAAEITREQIFLQLHQEVPYAVAVETEQWEQFDNGDIKISQVVMVERDTQKAILLGRRGSRIKEIGEKARLELQNLLENKVHLKIFVKVSNRWRDDPQYYAIWGLDPLA